jgi:hypothetical protein
VAGTPVTVPLHQLPANPDDDSVPAIGNAGLTLPFAFSYFTQAQTQFWFSTNGVLGFGTVPGNATSYTFGCPLPSTANPGNPVPGMLVFAADLYTGASGICASVVGSAPNRQLVVTWMDSGVVGPGPSFTVKGDLLFSAILSEGTNTIDLVYSTTMSDPDSITAVIGIQSANATYYSQYGCAVLGTDVAGKAIRFTPGP